MTTIFALENHSNELEVKQQHDPRSRNIMNKIKEGCIKLWSLYRKEEFEWLKSHA